MGYEIIDQNNFTSPTLDKKLALHDVRAQQHNVATLKGHTGAIFSLCKGDVPAGGAGGSAGAADGINAGAGTSDSDG